MKFSSVENEKKKKEIFLSMSYLILLKDISRKANTQNNGHFDHHTERDSDKLSDRLQLK